MSDATLRDQIRDAVAHALGEHGRDLMERGVDALPVTVENIDALDRIITRATDAIEKALERGTVHPDARRQS